MNTESSSFIVDLPDEEFTARLGVVLAKALLKTKQDILDRGLVINLNGDLGAGKTYLMRSMLRALGFEGRVKSPTFSLLETYSVEQLAINHFDFYRFEDPTEFEEAGFRENYGPGKVVASEWTSKAQPYAPVADLLICLKDKDEGRSCELQAKSEFGHQLLELIKNEYA